MKLSIITVVYNNRRFIEDCILSVLGQTYPSLEYIIIDGGSTDGTVEIVRKYEGRITTFISERDNGIYDAMNKGIALATGDVVGLLNADDLYAGPLVLERIAAVFSDPNVDACYSDLVYVDPSNPERTVRYWKSSEYDDSLFRSWWMPPHPTLYIRRSIYRRLGGFDVGFALAADSELMMRYIGKHRIRTKYLPEVTVKMRTGGATNKNIGNIIRQNIEIYRAARINGISMSLPMFLKKIGDRFFQYYRRPSESS